MALTWGFADRALAVEEISEFDTHVSTTQAGGHPDVDYAVTWTARELDNRPCNCEDARILDMHFPTGFIGDPHNVPACRLTEFALHSCSPESQVGVVDIQGSRAGGDVQPGAPRRRGRPHRLLRARSEHRALRRPPRADGIGLRPRRDDLADLPLLRAHHDRVHLWGVPADPSHDANRFPVGTTEGIDGCKPYPEGCFGPVKSTAPPAPYLQNPTTCGVPLTASHSIEYYSGVDGRGRKRLAGHHGLRSAHLQPEPDRDADHRSGRQHVGPRRHPQGAADAEPDDPLAVGDTAASR